MSSNRLALAAVVFTCVAAAAAGGYLASRQNVQPAPVLAAAAPQSPQPAAPAVQETEAVLGDSSKPSSLAPAPASAPPSTPPVSARRAEAPARPGQRTAQRPEATSARTPPPPLDRTWPSAASAGTPQDNGSHAAAPSDTQTQQSADNRSTPESNRAPAPPAPTFEELVVSANSVVGLQLDTAISSDKARVEDKVEARVVREVRVGNSVAIPSGAHAIGSVMVVDRGGRFKDRARLGIRFHTLVLADGTRVPITSETIYRYGDAPGNASAAKIGGGAVGGAILGAIIGGAKGAAIGATAGAGGGTAAVMASEPNAATFPAGTEVTARLLAPVTVTVEK